MNNKADEKTTAGHNTHTILSVMRTNFIKSNKI